jgi:hypothetical protein
MKIPGLGALKFHAYTRPLDALDVWLGARRLPEIEKSIHQLSPASRVEAGPSSPKITYLTGNRIFYQTVFSAYSLIVAAQRSFQMTILSDGTLSEQNVALLHELFPGRIAYVSAHTQEEQTEQLFPATRFPTLRRLRTQCALFRKLVDVHGGQTGWNLFVDSDTFFHRRPDRLLEWTVEASLPCYMLDHWSNYGHPVEVLEQIVGTPIIPHVNSGLVGLRSETIEWDRVEFWLTEMEQRGGRLVFFEQGLTAILLSQTQAIALPKNEYVVCPTRGETKRPTAAFHHYAGDSKFRYLRYNVPGQLLAS